MAPVSGHRFRGMVSLLLVSQGEGDESLKPVLEGLNEAIAPLADEHEIVLVRDSGSSHSLSTLRALVQEVPDVQVFALSGRVDRDKALLAGVENCIGDIILMLPTDARAVSCLRPLIEALAKGADMVVGLPGGPSGEATAPGSASRPYLAAERAYFRLLRRLTGIPVAPDTGYLGWTRAVSTFIAQHDHAEHLMRTLPLTAGFEVQQLSIEAPPPPPRRRSLPSAINKAVRMLLSTTAIPMRLVSLVAVAAALLNAIYAVYVVVVALTKADVAPGWTTLSLQMSGMFFIFSLLFAMVAEYMIEIHQRSGHRPRYLITQEMRSDRVSRRERLNVVDSSRG